METEQMLRVIFDYFDTHFHDEEKYMLDSEYPDYPLHKAEHDLFRIEIATWIEQYRIEKASRNLINRIENELQEWWTNHELKSDNRIGIFLQHKDNQSSRIGTYKANIL